MVIAIYILLCRLLYCAAGGEEIHYSVDHIGYRMFWSDGDCDIDSLSVLLACGGEEMIDYSQNHEQRFILKCFAGKRGIFLDIGANDGVTFSNTRALYETQKWGGVFVEPSPAAFKALLNNYHTWDYAKGDGSYNGAFVNAAITTQDGPIDFWDSGTHLRKGDTSLLSTTVPSTTARWKTSGEKFTKTTVRGITFATLMRETGVSRFDFISIDAEGADYDILKQIDLRAVGCRCLCVEYNMKDQQRFCEYAAKFGMRLAWRNRENLIFVIQ